MPVKKEAAHDCKAECAELHKQLEALKKEVQALKVELKKAPKNSGGADPRVDLLVSYLFPDQNTKNLKLERKDIINKLKK